MYKPYLKLFFLIVLHTVFSLAYAQKTVNEAIKTKLIELEQQADKFHQAGNKKEEADCLNQMGYVYWEQNFRTEAAGVFIQSLKLNLELNNLNAVKSIYNNLGFICSELEEYQKALDYFNENMKINRSQKKRKDVASALQNIGQVQYAIRQYNEAASSLEEAAGIALEYKDMKLAQSCYLQLADTYEKLGDNQKSRTNYEKSAAILSQLQKQILQTVESQKNTAESQKSMAETEARQNARQLQSAMDTLAEIKESYREVQLKNELKDLAIREEQLNAKANRHLFYFTTTALVLLIFILLLVYYQFRQKKKANQLLEEQKFEIERQRDLANEQKQKITDSIQYAQRIQNAILPPKPLLEELIEDHFILFIPKDIVSGDFYWLTQKDNILVLAAADCTGHGVPGALMSMLGIAFLNEIVNKIAVNRHISSLQSDEILNELRRNIIVSLHQTGNIDESMDGMDISLCIIDFETDKLQYSGAHNPLYLIRDGGLIQYNGDKMPLGYHKNKDVPFTRHDINLKKGDMLYVFTDGYIDQFGGEQGFKFLSKNLKKLVLQIHGKPMNEQKQILLEEFVTWRGERDQLDDILLFGFRFLGRRKLIRKDEKYSWQDKQILIAEDTDVNYYLLAEALKLTKATLTRVKTGKEAVEFCKSNDVDLILMDIRMPEMDGYEATAAIKSFKKEIPIIIQTALGASDEKDISTASGADDYISKPIDMKSFLIKLEHYLD